LFFYLVQQFALDGNRAHHFEFGARGVGIKLGEVVAVPESPIFSPESALEILLNLFSFIGFALLIDMSDCGFQACDFAILSRSWPLCYSIT
jgi:hypothetical protein